MHGGRVMRPAQAQSFVSPVGTQEQSPSHAGQSVRAKSSVWPFMKIYLDGELVDRADAKISVFDHGLLYGDGIFEGIRMYDGNVFRLEEHLERLEYSAKALLLKIPLSRAEMSKAVCDTCRENGLRSEEHTSELQSRENLVCRLLLEKKN